MKILDEIIQDIERLKAVNGQLDLNSGLEIQQRLASNSYFLATLVADASEARNNTEYMYKSSVNSFLVNYKGEKLSEKRLEALAKEQYKELYKQLTSEENLFNRLTLILRQTNINIETLRQTNSQLKVEFRNQVSGGG